MYGFVLQAMGFGSSLGGGCRNLGVSRASGLGFRVFLFSVYG